MSSSRTVAGRSHARARSISRWACALVSIVAFCIVATVARVVQLKVDPDQRLASSMEDANGKLAQQRSVADALPRGEILDRNGRTLALDTLSGTLYVDVRDLYRDTLIANRRSAARIAAGKGTESDRIVLDPISELAAQLGPMLGVAPDEIADRIVHRDVAAKDHRRVPAALRRIPASGELSDDEWGALPRYVVIEKDMTEDQIRLLRAAREAGGPASIVRAAHMQPKSERVRPYGDIAAPLVGKTGIDVISDVPLDVDLRALLRESYAANTEAIARIAGGESAVVIDDPIGPLADGLAPIAELAPEAIVAALVGSELAPAEARLRWWAIAMQSDPLAFEEFLEAVPTGVTIKERTTPKDRERLLTAQRGLPEDSVLAFASLGTGMEGVVGRSGVERLANSRLSSQPGYTTYFASRLGSVISIPPGGYRQGDIGEPVRLSIDIVIQELVEARLDKMVADANAAGGRCLVVHARTGEVLAAYSTINEHAGREGITTDWGAKDPALARMRWATDPFEPGSIFKAFVWAWATDHGYARRSERFMLPSGPLVVSDGRAKRPIKEAHPSSYGPKTWEEVLVKSVNAGMATVAFRMGSAEMRQCLADWRFGESTDIGVESESSGIMPRQAEWSNKTRALTSVSFGQGIAVTPLQLARAFTAFCRNGEMVPLSLQPIAPDSLTGSTPVLSASAVREAREVMEKVITDGTGKRLKDTLVYRAFGKSGTAQWATKNGYAPGKYLASFIAGAPFEAPEIVVLVTIEDPDSHAKATNGATGGGAVAGPVVAHIINDVLGYMGIPTDGELAYADRKGDGKKLAGR